MHVHFGPMFWMVLVIVIVALKHRRKMEAMRLGLPDRRAERRRERELRRLGRRGDERRTDHDERGDIDELRERVHVLERIATDGRSSRELADEIEALRDKPAPKAPVAPEDR